MVLPQPDSPTRPRVWPRPISKLTSATALTEPTRRCITAPLVTAKSLTRLRAWSRVSEGGGATMGTGLASVAVTTGSSPRSAEPTG